MVREDPSYCSTFHIYDRLLTHADRRLTVEQIKKHSFFYGVDWDTIRHMEAPFVPRLRSITDTSYFPTDEIEQVDEEQSALTSETSKDLAFLGCVSSILGRPTELNLSNRYTFKRFSVS